MENSGGKPYKIVDSGEGNNCTWEIRYFKNEDPSQLFWHRDKEDREVQLLWGNVSIQLDNYLPVNMHSNESLFIPAERFHRVISKEPFIIRVYKYK